MFHSNKILLGVFGLSMTLNSFANCYHVFHKEDWMLKVAKNLKLNDKQEKDITKISEDSQKDIKKYHDEFLEIQEQINNDIANNHLNDENKSKIIDKELKMSKKVLDIKLKERMDIYQQLTPEQQKMFTNEVSQWIKQHKN